MTIMFINEAHQTLRLLVDELKRTDIALLASDDDSIARLTVRLPNNLSNRISEAAKKNRTSVNQYITQALLEKLALEQYIDQVEEEIDNYSLLSTADKSIPKAEALLDMDKYGESQLKRKLRKNDARPKLKLMRNLT